MTKNDRFMALILAEIVRLQRWAGGDRVSAARVFGLMHGFESVLDGEREDDGISRETQDKVEDLLEAVEDGTQAVDGLAVKSALYQMDVEETDADCVMQLCLLQSRFIDGIKRIAEAPGSRFASLLRFVSEERQWQGALHYIELFDGTDEVERRLHGAFVPCIPRVGEIIQPERGSKMTVIAVHHVAIQMDEHSSRPYITLIPHVVLEAIND